VATTGIEVTTGTRNTMIGIDGSRLFEVESQGKPSTVLELTLDPG
jgi:hypothetical protein